jgi:hypothetical protein
MDTYPTTGCDKDLRIAKKLLKTAVHRKSIGRLLKIEQRDIYNGGKRALSMSQGFFV